jgi:hypothetical protein
MKSRKPEQIIDEPGMEERFQRAFAERAQHAAETPHFIDTEAKRAARIKVPSSIRENAELISIII